MFSRWGAFVYRFRRPVALLAIVVAVAVAPSSRRRRRAPCSSGGWLDADSESAAVADRLDDRVRRRQELRHRALPVGDARRRRDVARVPGARSPRRSRRPRRRPARRPASSATPRPATSGSSAPTATRPTSSSQLDMHRRGVGRRSSTDIRARDRPAGRLHLPADRLRARSTKDSAEPVREGPPAGRDRVAADRRAHPHPRLRLARRGGHAAARRRPGHPDARLGADLPRRPAGRDEHLRPEHRDDARASRSPSTTRCSSSAGSARSCARGRTVGEAVERAVATERQGRRVLAASPSPSGCPGLLLFEAPAIRSIGIAGALVVARARCSSR